MNALVTGSTGTVGSHVLEILRERGKEVRAATRDSEDGGLPDAVEAVHFDFEKPETWGPAFDGADAMFLMRPPQMGRVSKWITPAIDAAIRSGVEHVVFLSVLGAEKLPILPHRRIEKHLEDADVTATFLRASFFMENLTAVHGSEILERGKIGVPAGDGETSFVAAADIAAVAVTALMDSQYAGRAYDVTGPEALTYHEVADLLSEILGQPVRYTNPSLVEFARHSRRLGRDWSFIGAMAVVYTTARLGIAGSVTDDVQRVLGRPPTSLREWAREHTDWFRQNGETGSGEE